MCPPANNRSKSQQDRQRSLELLKVYGSLLTPKQYAMTAGYCMDGKSFSQIAREQGVSRQAVHEAVRGVQRLLRYYEEKLHLAKQARSASRKSGSAASKAAADGVLVEVVSRLESLCNQVKRKGIIEDSDWLIDEIEAAIQILEADKASPSAQAAEDAKPNSPSRRTRRK